MEERRSFGSFRQSSFGAGDVCAAGIELGGSVEGARKGFEEGLDFMMVIFPSENTRVEVEPAEGFSQADERVLGSVVFVNVQVAFGMNGEVKESMRGEESEHVIEETDARADASLACAIQIEDEGDVGFVGAAFEGYSSHRKMERKARVIAQHQIIPKNN